MKHDIKYSNCWEDAFVLQEALEVNATSKILCIASAGDNSLFLLSFSPQSMHCIDINIVQLYITKLKEQSISSLDYDDFLCFLGFENCDKRTELFDKIKNKLPQGTREFFENNIKIIENGIVHQGKFEGYFQLFAKRILPLIHKKSTINKLVENKSAAAQKEFYKTVWNSWRWRILFKMFFCKTVMKVLGRDKEKFKDVVTNVGQEVFNRTARHFKCTEVQQNYLLDYCLHGAYKNHLPPYAEEAHFNKIKTWLQTNTITYQHVSFDEYMQTPCEANCYNLSNIFEYLSMEDFKHIEKSILQNAPAGSRFHYWELFNERKMNECFTKVVFQKVDAGFFYNGSRTYIKK